ncbi:hypothetical protein MHBO_003696, partial [Bonamia ostreae]
KIKKIKLAKNRQKNLNFLNPLQKRLHSKGPRLRHRQIDFEAQRHPYFDLLPRLVIRQLEKDVALAPPTFHYSYPPRVDRRHQLHAVAQHHPPRSHSRRQRLHFAVRARAEINLFARKHRQIGRPNRVTAQNKTFLNFFFRVFKPFFGFCVAIVEQNRSGSFSAVEMGYVAAAQAQRFYLFVLFAAAAAKSVFVTVSGAARAVPRLKSFFFRNWTSLGLFKIYFFLL